MRMQLSHIDAAAAAALHHLQERRFVSEAFEPASRSASADTPAARRNDRFATHEIDDCATGSDLLGNVYIRPLRVGSLDHPERYRNLGAFVFLVSRRVRM